MARVKVRHLVEKDGRYYWQPSSALANQGWKTERLPNDRVKAIARAEALNADLDSWRAGTARLTTPEQIVAPPVDSRLRPGTVAWVANAWRSSPEWSALAPKTKRSYEQCLTRLLDWCGDTPPRSVTPKRAVKYYQTECATAPAFAAAQVRVARILWKHAVREELDTRNPWRSQEGGPAIDSPDEQAGRLWSPAAIALMVKLADEPDKSGQAWPSMGTAILLNSWLGQRQGDVLALKRSMCQDGVIKIIQSKTKARVELPYGLVEELSTRLTAELFRGQSRSPTSSTLLVCETTGNQWKEDHFRHAFAALRDRATTAATESGNSGLAAELPKLQFMHLRHTAITRLIEAGCTAELASAITGHTLTHCVAIIDRYCVRTADMAKTAFGKRVQHEAAKKKNS